MKLLLLKRLKILCHEHVINDVIGEEIVEIFYEKELKKNKQIIC